MSDTMSASASCAVKTTRLTLRLPEGMLASLDEKAEEAGTSRSDYLRALIELPIEVDEGAIRHTGRGYGELVAARPDDGGELTLEILNPPGTVTAISDEALDAIRAEVKFIGIQYNEAVRSLNRVVKKYARNKYITADEKKEVYSVLKRAAKQNEAVYRAARAIASKVDELAGQPSVRLNVKMRPRNQKLPAVGENEVQPPVDKMPEPENADIRPACDRSRNADGVPRKRHRTRGKRKRAGSDPLGATAETPTFMAESVAPGVAQAESQLTSKANLMHPAEESAADEGPAADDPGAYGDRCVGKRIADGPDDGEVDGWGGRFLQTSFSGLDELMSAKFEEAEIGGEP